MEKEYSSASAWLYLCFLREGNEFLWQYRKVTDFSQFLTFMCSGLALHFKKKGEGFEMAAYLEDTAG